MDINTLPISKTYPTATQSVGITGILIVSMLLFLPINFIFTDILGKELTILFYYVSAMGVSFWIVNSIRKKITGDTSFVLTIDNPRLVPLVVITALALLFGIIAPLGTLIPMPDIFKEAFRTMSGQTGIFAFISIVIAAPILEELLFRGIMLEGLLNKYGPVRSIMISSLLFGFVHLNPWQFITGFGIGIFSGWVYYRTRSLLPSIIIHFAVNLSGFSARLLADPDSVLEDTIITMYGGLTNLIAVITGSIIVIWICIRLLKREFKRRDANMQPYDS